MSEPSGDAGVLLRGVELPSASTAGAVDVRVRGGLVAEIAPSLSSAGELVVDGGGGSLLPGLHDHHIHLFALAAAEVSLRCDRGAVRDRDELTAALRQAVPSRGWVRVVGYDEVALGELDRDGLDAMRSGVPVRVQHRSGALWVLNSAAVSALGVDQVDLPGIERDPAGRVTGRLWRLDGWLREQLAGTDLPPDLGEVSRRLAATGVTGVTDATPELDEVTTAALRSASLMQRLVLMGDRCGSAPAKLVVADSALPTPEELGERVARVRPRPVALHCVSRVALVLALSALTAVGTVPGDRIEHAAVCPPELTEQLARLGVTVVTQPSLVAVRGDDYLDRVDPEDVEALWPFASLLAGGVAVGCSSDAPYGDPDPWVSMAAAVARRAPSGRPVNPAERVSAEVALAGYLSDPGSPGGPARRLVPGSPADAVLLDCRLGEALREPSAERVRLTLIGGRVAFAHPALGVAGQGWV